MLDCILLCGRLGKWINSTGLVNINQRPLIDHQLYFLEGFENIQKIILAMHNYNTEAIKMYLDRRYSKKSIILSPEERPLGTGGAVKKALESVTLDWVLVYNYNNFININILDLERYSKEKDSSIICSSPTYKSPYGHHKIIDGRIEDFKQKPIKEEFTSCGWYLFKTNELREVLDKLPGEFSLEKEVFEQGLIKLLCYNILDKGYLWNPIDSPEDVERIEAILERR